MITLRDKIVGAVSIYLGKIVDDKYDTALLDGSVVSFINAMITNDGKNPEPVQAIEQWKVKNGLIYTKWNIHGIDIKLNVPNTRIGLVALTSELVDCLSNPNTIYYLDKVS